MKINCGPDRQQRQEQQRKDVMAKAEALVVWHRVFAWLPIRVGSHDCRWLEYVERRFSDPRVVRDVWGEYKLRPRYPEYRAIGD